MNTGKISWPKPGDPSINLAIEEYIYRNCPEKYENTILLWVNERSVIVGRLSKQGLDYNCKAARKYGIPVYRRFTGGGAVYHDENILSITLIGIGRRTPQQVYQEGVELIIEALQNLGIKAEKANEGDITLEGRCKIGGSAAHIGKNAYLYHAVISYTLPVFINEITPPRKDLINLGKINPVKYTPCIGVKLLDNKFKITESISVVATRFGYELSFLDKVLENHSKCNKVRKYIKSNVCL